MENREYTIKDILNHIPHRSPFIMVDKVLSIDYEKSAEAIKCVSFNEPYLSGHFPDYPVVPGVMLIESIAQVAGFMFYNPDNTEDRGGFEFLLVGVDKAKFKLQVQPGDIIIIRTKLTAHKMSLYFFSGTIHKRDIHGNETLAASAEVKVALTKILG